MLHRPINPINPVSDDLVLHLPFPPSLNNLFINVRGKGRAPSARYAAWRRRATQAMWGSA